MSQTAPVTQLPSSNRENTADSEQAGSVGAAASAELWPAGAPSPAQPESSASSSEARRTSQRMTRSVCHGRWGRPNRPETSPQSAPRQHTTTEPLGVSDPDDVASPLGAHAPFVLPSKSTRPWVSPAKSLQLVKLWAESPQAF